MVLQLLLVKLKSSPQLKWRGQDGQALVEYSLLIALIALTAIGGLTAFSVSSDNLYDTVKSASDAMSGALP